MALKLNVIIGSTRPGRAGPSIGKWVADFATQNGGFDVALVDLADFKLPLLDEAAHPMMQQYQHEHTKKWSKSVASADAFLFVTPEYDYFPPASLVNAIQVLSKEWGYKPAAVVSYAFVSGGLRASQPLRQLLSNLNVHAIPQSLPIPFFPQFVDKETGVFTPNEPMIEGAKGVLGELLKWATALKPMRA